MANDTAKLHMKVQYAVLLQITLAYGFLKLSITFFYRRLFVVRSGSPFDWASCITIAICSIWTIAFFSALIFQCGRHVSANWGSVEDDIRYCQSSLNIEDIYSVSDVLTDSLVWLLPTPVVSHGLVMIGFGSRSHSDMAASDGLGSQAWCHRRAFLGCHV